MTDRPVQGDKLETLIDHGVRSLVERDAPPEHMHRIRARVTAVGPTSLGRSRWLQPALATAALLVAAAGVGLWTLRDNGEQDVLDTQIATLAPLRPPSAIPPAADLRSAILRDMKTTHAQLAREAEVSQAKLAAYVEALHQLPPEVLLDEWPAADEPLPEPAPIVIPEIVITPLDARATPNEDSPRGDFDPRGDE
ncbi:MAG: hypothetical protein GEU99_06950 [Luteitalea sp.]|nr:hypothetical protein [Luteitalea sp.]